MKEAPAPEAEKIIFRTGNYDDLDLNLTIENIQTPTLIVWISWAGLIRLKGNPPDGSSITPASITTSNAGTSISLVLQKMKMRRGRMLNESVPSVASFHCQMKSCKLPIHLLRS